MRTYSSEEVLEATTEYFGGDELAAQVFFKYALKKNAKEFVEKTPDDMHHRLAGELARIEKKFPNPLSEEYIYSFLKDFSKIVLQGSPMYGVGNDYKLVSLSNCVVVDSPTDTMSSILEQGKQLANLFKRRCGVGIDISKLRPEGAKVNNSAETSSGAWSFADFYSYVTRMVGQSGRRGALMITMDVKHPDIMKFVTMKKDLTKVTGANVSVKISDEFMEAVESGADFTLQFPVDSSEPTHTETVSARTLWDLIIETATKTAEPGLMMWDNITSTLPAHCYPEFKTITTNPCGEVPLSAGDSCRLISINLYGHVLDKFTESARIDPGFEETVRVAMRLIDDLVELELEKLAQIRDECDTLEERELFQKLYDAAQNGRRTGLGTHGLADFLAALRMPYDSSDAVLKIDELYKQFKECAYRESIQLAKERGAFPAFDWELEKDCAFFDSFPADLLDEMSKYGRRNISILTCAPTGSVSIESQTSSGVEPIFRLSYTRRKKLNHDETDVEPDFIDDLGDKWKEFTVYHKAVKDAMEALQIEEIPAWFVTSDQIDWEKRIDIQAAMQRHIDHSISSTINLPKNTKPKDVAPIYEESWRRGLKGVTIYVDGTRTGVLVSEEGSEDAFIAHDAAKRPETIPCDIHHVKIKGESWVIIVGKIDGRPYEIFGGKASKIELGRDITKGTLTKKKFATVPNRYTLETEMIKINDILSVFDNPDNGSMTRMLSLALRHGARPNYIVEQLQKDKNSNFASFTKVVARVIKEYIEDGQAASVENTACDTKDSCDIVYQEGCATCLQCGWAKCM